MPLQRSRLGPPLPNSVASFRLLSAGRSATGCVGRARHASSRDRRGSGRLTTRPPALPINRTRRRRPRCRPAPSARPLKAPAPRPRSGIAGLPDRARRRRWLRPRLPCPPPPDALPPPQRAEPAPMRRAESVCTAPGGRRADRSATRRHEARDLRQLRRHRLASPPRVREFAAARRGGQERRTFGLAGEKWSGGAARRLEQFDGLH